MECHTTTPRGQKATEVSTFDHYEYTIWVLELPFIQLCLSV